MKIPKGCDIRLETSEAGIEMHITAALTTRVQADELIKCIKQIRPALEGDAKHGSRKSKISEVA